MLITLLKLKCARESEELKVKGRKRSGWNKITTTLNESKLYNSDQISSLKVHELNFYLVRHGIVFKGKKPEKVSYIKAKIASRGSNQAWRKGLHCVKKLQLWAQKVMKRKGL